MIASFICTHIREHGGHLKHLLKVKIQTLSAELLILSFLYI
jgi:hypothetical protein